MFARKHAARAPEAGKDFIRDQQHSVAVTQPPHAAQKFARPNNHAARALKHGFDQNRSRVLALLLQTPLQIAQAVDAIAVAARA